MNKHFSEENIQMAKKQMKRCYNSLVIWEMQIKTTIDYYFTLTKMVVILKWITSVSRNVQELEPWCIADENVKCHSHCGKQFGGSLKA